MRRVRCPHLRCQGRVYCYPGTTLSVRWVLISRGFIVRINCLPTFLFFGIGLNGMVRSREGATAGLWSRSRRLCRQVFPNMYWFRRKSPSYVEITIQCYDRRPDNIPMFVTSWELSRESTCESPLPRVIAEERALPARPWSSARSIRIQ